MVRLRRQFSLARLIAVTCALAINFAWLPWPSCAVSAVGLILPLFLSGVTRIEWIVIYSIIGFLMGLLMPAVVHHHPIRKVAPIMAAPPPSAPGGGLPRSGELDEPED
jgi:hypothetical protein